LDLTRLPPDLSGLTRDLLNSLDYLNQKTMKNIYQTRSVTCRSGMILAVLLLSTLIFQTLAAQDSRATIEGRVTDQEGAIIPGATVIASSDLTGVKQQTVTNDQGMWTIPFLNPGAYTISISAPGFKSFERRGITLQVADIKRIDTTLQLGNVSENV